MQIHVYITKKGQLILILVILISRESRVYQIEYSKGWTVVQET